MITYQITVTSKNPKSLKFFFLFCFCYKNKIKSLNLKTKFYKKKIKKKIITTLKSPHVNKKAQKHLEYRLFSTKIIISLHNITQYLILLKKIKLKLFPEIKIKLKLIINKQNNFQLKAHSLHPKNFTINLFNHNNIQKINLKKQNVLNKKTLRYIKIFDCFGELNLTQNISKK